MNVENAILVVINVYLIIPVITVLHVIIQYLIIVIFKRLFQHQAMDIVRIVVLSDIIQYQQINSIIAHNAIHPV